MQKNINLTCCLIGEESLTLECACTLLAQGWKIVIIISSHPGLQRWAKQHGIPYFLTLDNFTQHNQQPSFDYLFSIVNPAPLPSTVLAMPKQMAINYHDGPLPKYAGVHATSWALIKGETYHGISWHVMTPELDAGDLLLQVSIKIEVTDTTLTLNQKCFEAAISSFAQLITQVKEGTFTLRKQDLAQRSYFGYQATLPNFGIINWEEDIEQIDRYYRASLFGKYANRFGRVKCLIDDTLYLIEELSISLESPLYFPGTIISSSTDAIKIASKNGVITLQKVQSIYGEPISITQVIDKHQLAANIKLDSFPSDAVELELAKITAKQEGYWLKSFKECQPIQLQAFCPITPSLHSLQHSFDISDIKEIARSFFEEDDLVQFVIALAIVYFHNITCHEYDQITVAQFRPSHHKCPLTRQLFLEFIPITLSEFSHISFYDLLTAIRNLVTCHDQHIPPLKDIFSRDPKLNEQNQKDNPVVIVRQQDQRHFTITRVPQLILVIDDNTFQLKIITNCLRRQQLQIMGNHLLQMAHGLAKNPTAIVDIVKYLDCSEVERYIKLINPEPQVVKKLLTVKELFEQQVKQHPTRNAISDADGSLTYTNINYQANQLAHYLLDINISPGDRVIVQCERGIKGLLILIALTKINATYVPLNTATPHQRIEFIINDCEPKLIITDQELFSSCEVITVQKLILNSLSYAISNPSISTKPEDACCIIYSSGTSGKPKGIEIPHQGIIRLVNKPNYIKYNPTDKVAHLSNIAFDAATFEIWSALLNGIELYIISDQILFDMQQLIEVFQKNNITISLFTTSLFNQLVSCDMQLFANQRYVFFGGEAANPAIVRKFCEWRKKAGLNTLHLINAYGPTENTTISTFFDIKEVDENAPYIPIGKPISATTAYVVNTNGEIQPPFFSGELWLGGDGLALGYVNNNSLNQKNFVHDFFNEATLYRTGDIVFYDSNGNIVYLTRNDLQVKIKGFRIELNEIRYWLLTHPLISDAVVTVKTLNHRKTLIAYYVSDDIIDTTLLQNSLKERLPHYMVPHFFIAIDNIPLTVNHKIDFNALPTITTIPCKDSGQLEYKASSIESNLLSIWREVLAIEHISLDDDFFKFGGDSISSMQICARCKEKGIYLSSIDIFQTPTIRKLALKLNDRQHESKKSKLPSVGMSLFTPIQRWFFERKLPRPNGFVQYCALEAKENIDILKLQMCLKNILNKHRILKTKFINTNHSSQDSSISVSNLEIAFWKISETPHSLECLSTYIEQLTNKIDIKNGVLINAAVISPIAKSPQYLLLVAHHLVVDAVSWHIILNELNVAYNEKISHLTVDEGPTLTDYLLKLNSLTVKPTYRHEIEYWQNIEEKTIPLTAVDVAPPIEKEVKKSTVVLPIDWLKDLECCLSAEFPYRTYHILLTAFIMALNKIYQQSVITINLESHGRQLSNEKEEFNNLIGWFTALFPFQLELSGTEDPIKLLAQVKQKLDEIPNFGIGYGLYRTINGKKWSATDEPTKQPDVSFNYLGKIVQGTNSSATSFAFFKNGIGFFNSSENPRNHSLEAMCWAAADGLYIEYAYSSKIEKKIKALTKEYSKSLKNLINKIKHNAKQLLKVSLWLHSDWSSIASSKFTQEDIEYVLPLSPLQRGLIVQQTLNKKSYLYFSQVTWEFHGDLNENLLKTAWGSVISRHDVLRASFIWQETILPLQIIHSNLNSPIYFMDYADVNTHHQETAIERFLEHDRELGFHLDSPPLFHLTVIKLGEKRYQFVFSHHHILLDGRSNIIIINELHSIYNNVCATNFLFKNPPSNYKNYIDFIYRKNHESHKIFWKDYIDQMNDDHIIDPTIFFSSKRKKHGSEISNKYQEYFLEIPKDLSIQCQAFCKTNQLTLNTLYQFAWALVNKRYGYQDTVIFGMTISARPTGLPGSETIVGLCINTLPFIINFNKNLSVKDYLQQTQILVNKIIDNSGTSLGELQNFTTQKDIESLFTSLFVFENYGLAQLPSIVTNFKVHETTHYPLTITVFPDKEFAVRFSYATENITHNQISKIARHYQNSLEKIIHESENNIYSIDILTTNERKQIASWNNTSQPIPNTDLLSLFLFHVKNSPDHTAIVYHDIKLTYRELDALSNKVSKFLHQSACIKSRPLIAICLEPGLELLISLLGIIKAGYGYLPMEPYYPQQRKEYILNDSNANAVITSNIWEANGESSNYNIYYYQDIINQKWNDDYLQAPISSDALAYCTYTSGSTGKPKGVLVSHGNLLNILNDMICRIGIKSSDKMLFIASLVFDISGFEVFLPIITGGTIVVADENTRRDPYRLVKLIKNEQITIIQSTPSRWRALIDAGLTRLPHTSLLCCGEKLDESLACELLTISENVWNGYGPTETTIWSTAKKLSFPIETVSIGKPLTNTITYILDSHQQLTPVGEIGELYIGGAGVTNGYLHQAELNAKRFVTLSIGEDPSQRLYQTGDLVRYLPSGDIEYIDRVDNQIKIRGYRIEIDEIVAVLLRHENVKEAAIIIDDNNNIIAFYVTKNPLITLNLITTHLASILPEYMLPKQIIKLDLIPLTVSGKIDKQKLKEIFQQQKISPPLCSDASYSPSEKTLLDIWKKILGISNISLQDNFFHLGGNSLLAVKLISEINKGFSITLDLHSLFNAPTVTELDKLICSFQNRLSATSIRTVSHNILVCLQKNTSRPPLFLAPPVAGNIFWYIQLAQQLKHVQPVYGLQDPGLFSNQHEFTSIIEMASYYLQLIKKQQKHGPYYIGGASFGATIAVEMARQLLMENEQIAFLGIFDGWAYYPEVIVQQKYLQEVLWQQYHNMRRQLTTVEGKLFPPKIKLHLQRNQMLQHYVMPELKIDVTLFKAKKTLEVLRQMDDPDNHWRKFMPQLTTYQVLGDHETMFYLPQLNDLVEKLSNQLLTSQDKHKITAELLNQLIV